MTAYAKNQINLIFKNAFQTQFLLTHPAENTPILLTDYFYSKQHVKLQQLSSEWAFLQTAFMNLRKFT